MPTTTGRQRRRGATAAVLGFALAAAGARVWARGETKGGAGGALNRTEPRPGVRAQEERQRGHRRRVGLDPDSVAMRRRRNERDDGWGPPVSRRRAWVRTWGGAGHAGPQGRLGCGA
jgi:hypothetical protein